ncbi:MAG: HigA family addiction module antitoxin [Thermomicrobiales bacterium]
MPRHAFHPGEYLAEELDERGLTGADLARALDVPQNRVSEILNGKRAVTVDTALRLSRWMGTTPQYWLNLQQSHDLILAEKELLPEIERTVTPDASIAQRVSR